MIGQIADGILIADCFIANGQLIVIRQRIDNVYRHIPRITAFAVLCLIGKPHAFINFLGRPQPIVEALEAAMDMILHLRARIAVKLVFPATDRNLATSDAIGMTAHNAAHTRIVLFISRGIRIAQHYIDELRLRPHYTPADQPCPIRRNLGLGAFRIAQRVKFHCPSITEFAECFFSDNSHDISLQDSYCELPTISNNSIHLSLYSIHYCLSTKLPRHFARHLSCKKICAIIATYPKTLSEYLEVLRGIIL